MHVPRQPARGADDRDGVRVRAVRWRGQSLRLQRFVVRGLRSEAGGEGAERRRLEEHRRRHRDAELALDLLAQVDDAEAVEAEREEAAVELDAFRIGDAEDAGHHRAQPLLEVGARQHDAFRGRGRCVAGHAREQRTGSSSAMEGRERLPANRRDHRLGEIARGQRAHRLERLVGGHRIEADAVEHRRGLVAQHAAHVEAAQVDRGRGQALCAPPLREGVEGRVGGAVGGQPRVAPDRGGGGEQYERFERPLARDLVQRARRRAWPYRAAAKSGEFTPAAWKTPATGGIVAAISLAARAIASGDATSAGNARIPTPSRVNSSGIRAVAWRPTRAR